MRALWITKHGGPNVLQVRETSDPEPKKGEVKIRVKACGLNFAEVSARQGLYPDAPKPPCVVGYEGARVIEKLGEGVTAPAIGTRVLFMSYFGGMSDVVVVPTAQVAKIPDAMTFEEGAAIPVNYVTAMQMLFSIARVRYSILREGGLLVCFGMANVASPGKANWWKAATTFYGRPKFDPFDMMGQNRGVAGLNLGHMWHLQAMIQKSLTDCVTMYEQGKIKPHLDGVFSFDKAADAFGRIENGKNIGKVVLVPTLG